jgi:hypothetical protein
MRWARVLPRMLAINVFLLDFLLPKTRMPKP